MAKQDYSRFQKGVIKRFYENRDAVETQRLQEIVTEIYLATTPAKRKRLWERAAALLERTPDVDAAAMQRIIEAQDVEALAKIAGTRFSGD
jgi:chemotaxis regulatin CheY-phosphate phosphatase CheZ